MTRSWLNDIETAQLYEERGHMYWQNETLTTERHEKTMPKLNEMFGGCYLKAADLTGADGKAVRVTVEIEEVRQQLFTDDAGGEEQKWILVFKNRDKQLVMNKTNANAIGSQHGDDTDNWTGKTIRLYPTTTDFGGKQVPCIRVWLDPPEMADAEDEIPF